jgi:hypothetical protein
MMEAARTSETQVDIQLRTRQYIPEDSELNRELFYFFLSYLPYPTTPIYQAQATCLLLGMYKHALTSVCISCGQVIILCIRCFCLCISLQFFYYFKMNDETTGKFVQLHNENKCLWNMHTLVRFSTFFN